ncbi:hypothetical protein, partial [Streptomyces microflavus]|uniref:hypothetical protein n=1 Tax=Streptomyces microflavus TaxID=1919 RepID=UPI003318A1D7
STSSSILIRSSSAAMARSASVSSPCGGSWGRSCVASVLLLLCGLPGRSRYDVGARAVPVRVPRLGEGLYGIGRG